MQSRKSKSSAAAGARILPRLAALMLASILVSAPAYAEHAQPGAQTAPVTTATLFLPLMVRQHALEQLAFESDRDGNQEIYTMESDGSNQTRLTFNAADDYAPAWSPDGARIAFTSTRDGGIDIYVMNADGSNPVRLSTTSQDSWPSWSPDGSQIVFQSVRDGNAEIYVMNADGGGQTRLTNTPETEQQPEFSPDASKILYSFLGSDFFNHTMQGEIYVMNANGSGQTRLTFDQANDFYARWSPDGNQIVFFSQRAPAGLFVMQANGSGVAPLVSGDEPDWSADGERIAYFSSNGIYVAAADGSNAQLIPNHTGGHDQWPRWHP